MGTLFQDEPGQSYRSLKYDCDFKSIDCDTNRYRCDMCGNLVCGRHGFVVSGVQPLVACVKCHKTRGQPFDKAIAREELTGISPNAIRGNAISDEK